MPTKKREHWTPRDSDNASRLTLPLLLILERETPKALDAIASKVEGDRATIARALRFLCSRGLAHRREHCKEAEFYYQDGGLEVKPETIYRRWILSDRGATYRDRLIREGALAQLPERYQALGQIHRDRVDALEVNCG